MARRPDAYEMDRAYKRYTQIVESIPEYIRRNLNEMPANKGYIWKGVYLYGMRPKEKPYKKTVLFEKLPRGLLNIHEWNDNMYRMYEKNGKEPKQMILSERRKPSKFRPPKRAVAVEDMTKSDFPTLSGAPHRSRPDHIAETNASLWAKIQPQCSEVQSRGAGRRS